MRRREASVISKRLETFESSNRQICSKDLEKASKELSIGMGGRID
jgi:hypothetical protein